MARFDETSKKKTKGYCLSEEDFLEDCLTVKGVGQWAAELMKMTMDDAAEYARRLVEKSIDAGPEGVIAQVASDLEAKKIDVSSRRIESVMTAQRTVARDWVAQRVWRAKAAAGGGERRRRPRTEGAFLPPTLQKWKSRLAGAR